MRARKGRGDGEEKRKEREEKWEDVVRNGLLGRGKGREREEGRGGEGSGGVRDGVRRWMALSADGFSDHVEMAWLLSSSALGAATTAEEAR